MMSSQFAGKTVLIAGAANGQGRATAIAFAREWANVVAIDLPPQTSLPGSLPGLPPGLQSLATEIRNLGVRCLPFAADVRDDAAISAVVTEAIATFGHIDILFNNASVCANGLAHELPEEAWDGMLDINLKGAWLVARRVIPHMIAQKAGVIINNCSTAGLRGMNRLSHYAASKWGLVGLTKSWAIELAPHNIRVVSVHPSGANPQMIDDLPSMEGPTPRQFAARSANDLPPIVPWIEPQDVAEAVVYLASEKARFITGSQFVMDAGLLTR